MYSKTVVALCLEVMLNSEGIGRKDVRTSCAETAAKCEQQGDLADVL
jgi:hypothetical protein